MVHVHQSLHTITWEWLSGPLPSSLGDCKFGNIKRELKKLQAENGSDTKVLENEDLKRKISELQVSKLKPRSRNRAC